MRVWVASEDHDVLDHCGSFDVVSLCGIAITGLLLAVLFLSFLAHASSLGIRISSSCSEALQRCSFAHIYCNYCYRDELTTCSQSMGGGGGISLLCCTPWNGFQQKVVWPPNLHVHTSYPSKLYDKHEQFRDNEPPTLISFIGSPGRHFDISPTFRVETRSSNCP